MEFSGKQIYLRLLRHVAPYWRTFGLSIAAMVVLAATEPAIPALLKPMLDGSFVERDLSLINLIAVLIVLVFLVRGAAQFASTVGLGWISGKLVMDLTGAMFERMLAVPAKYYDQHPAGTLISKVTFDVFLVTRAATDVVTVLVRDSLAIIGLLGWMFYLDWKLTLVALTTAPVIVVFVKRLAARLRRTSHMLQKTMGEVAHVLEETLTAWDIIRVFSGQDYERRRFHQAINWARRYQFKFTSANALTSPTSQLLTAIALAAIVYLAAHQSAANEISVGGFVSYFAAMAMLFSPLKRLTGINGPLQRGLAAASSVFALMDATTEPDAGTIILKQARGRIDFKQVSFAYHPGAKPVLQDIDLNIEAGETVALVGPSGSGKTTLITLLPRFHLPTAGRILLDGVDIASVALASLRGNIALVTQDTVLFDDTVAANIAYGAMNVKSEQALVDAARAAHALEFIEELPEGFNTVIGPNGVRLSGGQRQRLAIARAFMKNAPLLILDEATSSLDTSAERHIQSALGSLRQGRTTIVIAHRLSTIETADRIVVMSEGRIVEIGTHASLLQTNTLYAGLYRFQFARHSSELAAADSN